MPSRRLRVLMISPYFSFPPTSGFEVRVCQLARQIGLRHDLTVLTYATPEDAPRVSALPATASVRVVQRQEPSRLAKRLEQLRSVASTRPFACAALHSSQMQNAIDELCATTEFDLIQLESSTLWSFRLPVGVPVVVDEHNIEYELLDRLYQGERSLLRRAFNRLEALRFRRFEEHCWVRATGCVVTSEREEPAVRWAAPATPTAVVPNAVDLDDFAPDSEPQEPCSVVFNATFNYRPNLDAALYLVDEVWPLVRAKYPDARLTLVGNTPEREARELARPGVELAGKVPDVRPYLRSAAVIAVPVRMGGGTRLKVVEALSLGKAIVTTTLGCEGIAVRDREHALIADDAPAFASAILRLFENPDLGAELGEAARKLAERSYSWGLAGERLEGIYRQIASGRPGTNRPAAQARKVAELLR